MSPAPSATPPETDQEPAHQTTVAQLTDRAQTVLQQMSRPHGVAARARHHAEIPQAARLQPGVPGFTGTLQCLVQQRCPAGGVARPPRRGAQHHESEPDRVPLSTVSQNGQGGAGVVLDGGQVPLVEGTAGHGEMPGGARCGRARPPGEHGLHQPASLFGPAAHLPEPPQSRSGAQRRVRVPLPIGPLHRFTDVGQLGLNEVEPSHVVGSAERRFGLVRESAVRPCVRVPHPVMATGALQPRKAISADRLEHREAWFVPGGACAPQQVRPHQGPDQVGEKIWPRGHDGLRRSDDEAPGEHG